MAFTLLPKSEDENINTAISEIINRSIIEDKSEVIEIVYMENIPKLSKINIGDWIDLCAADDYYIRRGENKLINLGVKMDLPIDYEAYVLPRSSTFIKYGCILLNSMGIIDCSYRGWWKANFYCLKPNQEDIYITDKDPKWLRILSSFKIGKWIIKHIFKNTYYKYQYTLISKGDRICQFRIMSNMPSIEFIETYKLENTERSSNGFGSTGV